MFEEWDAIDEERAQEEYEAHMISKDEHQSIDYYDLYGVKQSDFY